MGHEDVRTALDVESFALESTKERPAAAVSVRDDRRVTRRESPCRVAAYPDVGVTERQRESVTVVRSLLRRLGEDDRNVSEPLRGEHSQVERVELHAV